MASRSTALAPVPAHHGADDGPIASPENQPLEQALGIEPSQRRHIETHHDEVSPVAGLQPAGLNTQRRRSPSRSRVKQGGRDPTCRVSQGAPLFAAKPLTVLEPPHFLQ